MTAGEGEPVPGRARILLLLLVALVGFAVVARELYRIQVTDHEEHLRRAMRQWTGRTPERQRGTVYDRRGRELAVSIKRWTVAYDRSREPEVEGRRETARKLAPILGLERGEVLELLEGGSEKFAYVARRVDDGIRDRIEAQKLRGIFFQPEYQRMYPQDSTAAHIVGFVGSDDAGLEGIERAQNENLQGPPVEGTFLRDLHGNPIPVDGIIRYPQFDGRNVYLTIDLVIQSSLEQALASAVSQFHAKGASGVVVDPQTGEILALANLPTYNLNQAREVEPDQRRNRALTDLFEPGSTFKIFSGALSLSNGLCRPEEPFECVGGIDLPGHRVKCVHTHGSIDYRRAIELSCNVAAILVCQRLEAGVLHEGLRAFGFGSRTGVGLPGEVPGTLRAPHQWSRLSQGMLAIGQEVSVTTIQLAMATAAMSNGGRLLVPRIVHSIRDQEGRTIEAQAPEVRAHPVDPSTSRIMGQLMSGVVRQGTGRLAHVAGFTVAGKTGTAQIAGRQGGYVSGRYNAVFVGWTPADAPVLAMAIVVNEPDVSKGYYGGAVAAPAFGRVGTEVMRYLRIGLAGSRDTTLARRIPPPARRDEGRVRGGRVEIPDLVGLSMREAHELVGRLPLTLKATGSGVAAAQSIPPGTPVPLDSVLEVEFQPPGSPAPLADIAP